MNQEERAPSQTVEGFIIDDKTHEVLLCRPVLTPQAFWSGVEAEVGDLTSNPPQNPTKEEPVFSLIRQTHNLLHLFIPPNEWIQLGVYTQNIHKQTLLFATTWDTARLKPNPSIDVVRVPLLDLPTYPCIPSHIQKALSSFV